MNNRATRNIIIWTTIISLLGLATACGDEENTIDSVSKDICSQYAKCDAEDFDSEFSSRQDCIDEYSADLREDREERKAEGAEDCFDIWLDVYDCLSSVSCEQWNGDDEDTICYSKIEEYDTCMDTLFDV